MKKLIALAITILVSYNFFGSKETTEVNPAPVEVAKATETIAVKQEETLSCYYVERIYAPFHNPTDEQFEKGDDAFERCLTGDITDEERALAWELQKRGSEFKAPEHIKKGFNTDQRKLAVYTTLG